MYVKKIYGFLDSILMLLKFLTFLTLKKIIMKKKNTIIKSLFGLFLTFNMLVFNSCKRNIKKQKIVDNVCQKIYGFLDSILMLLKFLI